MTKDLIDNKFRLELNSFADLDPKRQRIEKLKDRYDLPFYDEVAFGHTLCSHMRVQKLVAI